VLGSVYALIALGYTMVYGILQLINFAHGEVLMIGAMVAVSVAPRLLEAGVPDPWCSPSPCWSPFRSAWPWRWRSSGSPIARCDMRPSSRR
jgi:ABC-type branched-subunit amino acid transport system permease subunit